MESKNEMENRTGKELPGGGPWNGEQIHGLSKYYSGIDWASLCFRLLEKIHWVLLTAILCAALTGVYVKTMVTPIYRATSKLYIAGSETTISLSDIQLGSSLAVDYQEAFKIWHVHEMVDERLNLNYSYSKLQNMVSVNNPAGSHLLYINIQSVNPQEARQLADTYAEVVQEYISEKMELRKPQILEKAQLPTRPISPDVQGTIIKGFVFGLFAAAAVIVFLYLLDDRIRNAEDVEKATDLVTIGTVPKLNDKDRKKAAPGNGPQAAQAGRAERCVLVHEKFFSDYAVSEAVNTICSGIAFAGKNLKRIAVTSHDEDNGKTFVTLQVAMEMAKRGKKVLFMDGDLRKSALETEYEVALPKNAVGLAHLLSGQCTLEAAIYPTNYPNLYLIPNGKAIATPLPLLTSPDFEQLMELAGREFDLVLVDTPPIGAVVDAAEIAKQSDGCLLVLEYNRTSRWALQYAQKMLLRTGTPIIGCVINKVTVSKLGYPGYYSHYSHYYSHYGEKGSGRTRGGWLRKKGKRVS